MAIQNKNDMVKIFAVMAVDLNAKLLTEHCPYKIAKLRPTLSSRAGNEGSRSITITEEDPTMAFSLLKVPTSTFKFKRLWRHYAKLLHSVAQTPSVA